MGNRIVSAVFLLLLIILTGFYIDSLAHEEIALGIKLVLFTVTGTGLTLLVIASVITALVGIERFRMLRAQRRQADREADVYSLVANPGQQVYVRDSNHKATWHSLSLEPRVYSNGRYSEASQMELDNWRLLNAPPKIINTPSPLLPAAATTQPMDLLTALDSQQRVLIIGASNAGKTNLLKWIAARRQNDSHVCIIDPHSFPGKFPAGVSVFGMGRNYQEIDRILRALIRLMDKRYSEIAKGLFPELGHSRVALVIDEWRSIVANVPSAKEAIRLLLTESRKASFVIYFASHSGNARPLGLEREFDLRDGFCTVQLSIVNGQRVGTLDTGEGPVSVILPGVYQDTPQIIDSGDFDLLNSPLEPTEEERRILEMFQAGRSLNEIARKVYGSSGGHQVRKIKDILTRVNV